MENTSNNKIRLRDKEYYRSRLKNRVHSELVNTFADDAARLNVTKAQLANKLGCDPALVTRWLSAPSNLTLETISDFLLALDAEMDFRAVHFSDRAKPNAEHPFISMLAPPPPKPRRRKITAPPKPSASGSQPPATIEYVD